MSGTKEIFDDLRLKCVEKEILTSCSNVNRFKIFHYDLQLGMSVMSAIFVIGKAPIEFYFISFHFIGL